MTTIRFGGAPLTTNVRPPRTINRPPAAGTRLDVPSIYFWYVAGSVTSISAIVYAGGLDCARTPSTTMAPNAKPTSRPTMTVSRLFMGSSLDESRGRAHQFSLPSNGHGERPAAWGRSAPPCCSTPHRYGTRRAESSDLPDSRAGHQSRTYLALFQTNSSVTPAGVLGLVNLSSSVVSEVIMRF